MPMIQGPKEQTVLPDGQLNYQSSAGATPEAFGAGIGQATIQAGGAADNVAMRDFAIKNEADHVAADNAYLQGTIDLQNGNKEKGIVGYRTLIGQNAVDALPDYQAKLEDLRKNIRDGLNPAVARQFDQTSFRQQRGVSDSMGNYSSQQQVVGFHQAARSRVALAQQGALTQADDPGGFDAHLSDVQEASMAGSHVLGLGPDATEEQRRQDVGRVYIDRTKDLMVRNPMQAADFYHRNINAVPAEHRYELERMLKTTTDGQYAKGDGQTAYHTAIVQPSSSTPGLAGDVGAPNVKPFDQKRIDQVAAFVKSTTPWEKEINAAAAQYNVNPAEIKLKIGIESGGNPGAVNPEGGHGDHATGLGQFTADTAKRYGVTDRSDPVQSINGIARMLAANGGTVGGDMSKSDRAYFGGNVNAKGPNTDQYVENTRAARQSIMGGGAPVPLSAAQLEGQEGAVIAAAQTQAEQRRPGDPAYRDQVVSEAHRNWALDVQALKSRDYNNFSQVLATTVKSGALSQSDLPMDAQQTFSQLSPQNQVSIRTQFDHNARAARGEFTHSDPRLVNDLMQRIYAPEGSAQKITQPGQLTEYMGKGLNYTDQQRLEKEIKDANSPEGSVFLKQVASVKETARKMLTGSMSAVALAHPEMADEAAYRFAIDLDGKIKAARGGKIDPQSLLTPGSKDYVLDPNRVGAFMPTEQQIIARKAAAATAAPATTFPVARNPKTGERMMLKDGTWQPMS